MDSRAGTSAGNLSAGPATVYDAIRVADAVHERLNEAASVAEKLADTLDGPSPPEASASKCETAGSASLADHLTRTVDGLHSPTTRILHALDRIGRRLG